MRDFAEEDFLFMHNFFYEHQLPAIIFPAYSIIEESNKMILWRRYFFGGRGAGWAKFAKSVSWAKKINCGKELV